MERLPESVDRDILEQRIIPALMTIRETLGCTLHQAIDAFAQRYEELRQDRPHDFRLSRTNTGAVSTPERHVRVRRRPPVQVHDGGHMVDQAQETGARPHSPPSARRASTGPPTGPVVADWPWPGPSLGP
ncbi:hypothetical protein [Streptomyces cyaneogriseus]|uniref:hypothetical protein n=1 Tax=Streptomyces cyaneogriseus TaxID=68192 RepID=UPI000A8DCD50|nr:hypothetical protein [Streptomyces cyaneogriseus]